jgi:vitamin B12 transporter
MFSHRTCAATATAIAAACTFTNANAETRDEIVVMASLTPIERVHVGNAITVIDKQQIERQQARYVTDLLRQVPGFSVSETSSRGSQTQVRVRGAEGNHLLVIIDGVRANDAANGDEFRWELLSAYDVERIEIIRGPQSALYGSDALAGVMLIETRRDYQGAGISGFVEGGSNDTLNAGLSGGTGGEGWSVNYGLSRLDTDGTNASRSGAEKDGSDLTTASLGANFKATDNLSFDGSVRFVDSTSEFDPFGFSGLPEDGNQVSDSQQRYLQAGGEVSTLNGRVVQRLDARYFDTEREDFSDGAWVSSGKSDRTTITYLANIAIGGDNLALLAEHERNTFEQRGIASIFGDPNQDQAYTMNSVAADYQWYTTEKLTLLASARFDNYSDFDDALTGRLSFSYRATETTKLRAGIGTGQKVPTFTERFGFFPDQFIGNPDLEPEKSTAWEVGIDQSFLNGALETQLTYFNQTLEDEINGFAFLPDEPFPTAVNLSDDSKRKGIEAEARYFTGSNIELAATYTYTDTTQPDFAGVDVREVRRPRHAGSISGNYRFAAERANLYLLADYNGSQTDSVFLPPDFLPETVKLGNYWLITLTAGFDVTESLNVFARVTNLADEDYANVFGFNTPGREAYAGFKVTLGQ